MLWDAARANENLHIIIIAPNANDIFENRLKYINEGALSRVHDRVICLSYPFTTIISELKNNYVRVLSELLNKEKENINNEKERGYANWTEEIQLAIDCEFLSKAENILKKTERPWDSLESYSSTKNGLFYTFKGLLTAIINGTNKNLWIELFNKQLERINFESLDFDMNDNSPVFRPYLRFSEEQGSSRSRELKEILDYWITPLFEELFRRNRLLDPEYSSPLNSINEDLKKLEKLKDYLNSLKPIYSWDLYLKLRPEYNLPISSELDKAKATKNWNGIKEVARGIEKKVLMDTLGTNVIQFHRLR